jgi:hypothetical protein
MSRKLRGPLRCYNVTLPDQVGQQTCDECGHDFEEEGRGSYELVASIWDRELQGFLEQWRKVVCRECLKVVLNGELEANSKKGPEQSGSTAVPWEGKA